MNLIICCFDVVLSLFPLDKYNIAKQYVGAIVFK